MTIEQIQEQIRALPDDEVDQLGVWIYGDERERRATLKAVEEAAAKQRAEDAAALWEAHPDLKPEIVEAPKDPVAASVEEAAAKVDIEAYKPPTGAHDSYPKGAKFIYKGRVWESKMDGYCWAPDTVGIDERFVIDVTDKFVKAAGEKPKEKPVEKEPESTAKQWKPGIAVKVGEKYTHNGATYQVIQAHNTQAGWEPAGVPALWKKL